MSICVSINTSTGISNRKQTEDYAIGQQGTDEECNGLGPHYMNQFSAIDSMKLTAREDDEIGDNYEVGDRQKYYSPLLLWCFIGDLWLFV